MVQSQVILLISNTEKTKLYLRGSYVSHQWTSNITGNLEIVGINETSNKVNNHSADAKFPGLQWLETRLNETNMY